MIPPILIRLLIAGGVSFLLGKLIIKDKAKRQPAETILSNSIMVYIAALKLSLLLTSFSAIANEPMYLLYAWGSNINTVIALLGTTAYLFYFLYKKSEFKKLHAKFLAVSVVVFISLFLGSKPFFRPEQSNGNFTFEKLEEKKTLNAELIQLNKDQVLILNFWATWCPPCRAEMPDLNAFALAHPEANFITVNNIASEKAGLQTVTDFIENKGYGFKVVPDYNSELTQLFDVTSFPTTIVVNTNGEIIEKHVGVVSEDWLESFLEK